VVAQEPVTIGAEYLFYGDNTEFSNLFREGETLLGSAARVEIAADLGDRATLIGGVFLDQRFGHEEPFRLVRPVMSLRLRGERSQFTFGTLRFPRPAGGPDRANPHGLLPPIQSDTLAVARPYEAGLQWNYAAGRLANESWLNWQLLNTARAREVFDAGVVGRVNLRGRTAFGYQAHIVHHGGQQHNNGPVSDSWVLAPGVIVDARADAVWRPSFEAYGLVSRYVPDREQLQRATSGGAIFARAALEYHEWRGHLILWRGNDYIKEEGDPNYGGLRRDGARFRRVRDYAELGLTRTARPVSGLVLEGSARLHRIEDHYEYSYRILGSVALSWRIR
jgi:hypothetical protein